MYLKPTLRALILQENLVSKSSENLVIIVDVNAADFVKKKLKKFAGVLLLIVVEALAVLYQNSSQIIRNNSAYSHSIIYMQSPL